MELLWYMSKTIFVSVCKSHPNWKKITFLKVLNQVLMVQVQWIRHMPYVRDLGLNPL